MSATEKVTVKNDRGEYFVIANEGMTQKWRKDKSIAAVDVVQAFNVFVQHHVKGDQGHPTKAELEDVFNTSNTDDVVRMILETGEITKGTGMASKKQDSTRH